MSEANIASGSINSSSPHIYSLDGFRGILAIIVAIYHIQEWMGLVLPAEVEDFLARTAVYGVCGFFAISGASMVIAARNHPIVNLGGFIAFFIRRYARIAPLYYVVMIFYVAWPLARCWAGRACDERYAPLVIENLYFTFGLNEPVFHSAVTAGWSIGIEWVFYMLFPVAVLCMRLWRGAIALAILGVIALLWWDALYLGSGMPGWAKYAQFPAYVIYFAVGMLIGKVALSGLPRWNWWAVAAPALVYIIAGIFSDGVFNATTQVAGPVGWVFVFLTLVITAAISMISVNNNFVIAMSNILGKLSFAVYFLHYPVYSILMRYIEPGWSSFLLCIVISLVAAWIANWCVERPGQLGGKVMANWLSKSTHPLLTISWRSLR